MTDIQQRLDRDMGLLEYKILGDEGVLWVVTRDEIRVVPLQRVLEIRTLARRATDLLSAGISWPQTDVQKGSMPSASRAKAEYLAVAGQLARLLVAPAGRALTASQLLIVRDESF